MKCYIIVINSPVQYLFGGAITNTCSRLLCLTEGGFSYGDKFENHDGNWPLQAWVRMQLLYLPGREG
jgi:hypothetical protein